MVTQLGQKNPCLVVYYLYKAFASDTKNYHAWSYRLWLIERFSLYEGELDFIHEELQDGEHSNNSLWSYRYFILMKTREFGRELVQGEIEYALGLLEGKDMENEAPWVYIKGMLAYTREEQERSMGTNVKKWYIWDFPGLKERLVGYVSSQDNRFAYGILIEYAIAEGDKEKAREYLGKLKVIDRLRENYYQWRINRLQE